VFAAPPVFVARGVLAYDNAPREHYLVTIKRKPQEFEGREGKQKEFVENIRVE